MSILKYCSPSLKRRIMNGIKIGWLQKHKRKKYIIQAVLSYPFWITKNHFKDLLEERNRLTALHGEVYTFDHIIPINHPLVSGLSVPWNIQLIPLRCNNSKGNKWNPDQMEIDFEIQMPLFYEEMPS